MVNIVLTKFSRRFKDLTGQKFHRLTIISFLGTNERRNVFWLCQCECGEKTQASTHSLSCGNTKSCGCLRKETISEIAKKQAELNKGQRALNFKDLTGQQFGYLRVLRFYETKIVGTSKTRRAMWLCQCKCGKETVTSSLALRNGTTQSCGCYKIERTKQNRTTHGKSNTSEYRIWHDMLRRCYHPQNKAFKHYGDKGIGVCQGMKTFTIFFSLLGERPTEKHEVDRIENTGGYSCGTCNECKQNQWPMNCQWGTRTQQMRNFSRNHLLTCRGETLSLSTWAERSGNNSGTIWSRIKTDWGSVEESIFAPPNSRPRRKASLVK